MSEENREEKKSNKKLILACGILGFFVVVFAIGMIQPIWIIGIIWDFDVKDQLLKANRAGLDHKPSLEIKLNEEEVTIKRIQFRLHYVNTHNNPDEVEIRINRAIDVFNNLFDDPEKTYKVIEEGDDRILQFEWTPEIQQEGRLVMPDF